LTDVKEKKEKGDEQSLKRIVGAFGKVTLDYGGFKIVVNDHKKFNWVDAFEWFFKFGYQVYVEKKEDNICIVAEPVS